MWKGLQPCIITFTNPLKRPQLWISSLNPDLRPCQTFAMELFTKIVKPLASFTKGSITDVCQGLKYTIVN